jgi:hypothetical protein
VLITSSDSMVMTRSDNRYCLIAPHAPTTTPITVPSTEPMTSSRRLTPMRRHSSSATGWPLTVVPKSPRTAPATQWPYRSGIGLSRSSSAALASMTACGGRGLRCSRLLSGVNVSEVRLNVRNDARASNTR